MDSLSKEKRSWNMSRIKGKNTFPELLVRHLLHSMGYRYRLHRKDLPGKPDLVFPGRRMVLFVNGCYWHRHNGCYMAYEPKTNREFWRFKFSENVERDKRNYKKLLDNGWKVRIVWECALKGTIKLDGDDLASQLIDIMRSHDNFVEISGFVNNSGATVKKIFDRSGMHQ